MTAAERSGTESELENTVAEATAQLSSDIPNSQNTLQTTLTAPTDPATAAASGSLRTGIVVPPEEETILPLDEYVTQFSSRYQYENSFREVVHHYLGLKRGRRLKLLFGKRLRPGWYQQQTMGLIQEYATRIRTDLEHALEIKKTEQELEQLELELKSRGTEVDKATEAHEQVQGEYASLAAQRERALREAQAQFDSQRGEEETRKQKELADVETRLDAQRIVTEKVRQFLLDSPLLKVQGQGNSEEEIEFNDDIVVRRLENLFLKEIVEGIEQENGRGGFIAKVREAYEGVITHWDEIQDISELAYVDWAQSTILSRTMGFSKPQFPYLVVGRGEAQGKASIDTAIVIDTSGSMKKRQRFEMAQKTTLALHALMRNLNSQNQTYLAHYNSDIHPCTSADLMKRVSPDGGTRTDLALNWLLEKLTGRGPSLAYLMTDGYPEGCSVQDCITIAQRFRDHPYIKLRIFMIDGDAENKAIIRKIGLAAGTDTAIIPVENYQLANGLIKDVSQAIGEMYSISSF